MVPPLDEDGFLPPGVHRCTLGELKDRFGTGSSERTEQFEELKRYVELAESLGVKRIAIDGSFVSAVLAPEDVDIIVLMSDRYDSNSMLLESDGTTWPWLHIFLVDVENQFLSWTMDFFAKDRTGRPKGLLEVIL